MFILSRDVDGLDYPEYKAKYDQYLEYLQKIKPKLSLSPKNFIYEDWYRNKESHRCPNASWLEKLIISENGDNQVQIELKLLGAYHDGYITFKYSGVKYYKIQRHQQSVIESSHGDFRYNEYRLDEHDNIVHELDWYTLDENAIFLIACQHIEYIWEPIPEGDDVKRSPDWGVNNSFKND